MEAYLPWMAMGHKIIQNHPMSTSFCITELDELDFLPWHHCRNWPKISGRYLTLLLLLVAAPGRNVAWKGCRSGCEKGLGEPSNDGALQQCSLPNLEHRIGAPCPNEVKKTGEMEKTNVVHHGKAYEGITNSSQFYMSFHQERRTRKLIFEKAVTCSHSSGRKTARDHKWLQVAQLAAS